MTSRSELASRFGLALAAGVVGAFLLAVADLYWGFATVKIATTSEEKVLILAHALGRHLLVGLAFGFAQWPLLVLPRGRRLFDPRLLAYAAGLSAVVVWALSDLHEGPKARQSSIWPAVFWGVRLAVPAAILAGLFVVRPLANRMVERTRIRAFGLFLAVLLLAGALGAAWANATQLPGLYPGVHAALSFLALVLAAAGAALLLRLPSIRGDRGGRLALILLAAVVFIAVSVAAMRRPAFFPVKGAVSSLAPATVPAARWTNRFYDRFVIVRDLDVEDVAEWVRRQQEAGNLDVEEVLSKIPGRSDLNVLFISLDTVRFDHTGIGGYTRRNTTPNLDRLVREEGAFDFQQAYTPYPTSNYAYSSVFTAFYPGATPLHDYRLNNADDWTFPPLVHFPELLSKKGLRSTAVTAFARPDIENTRYFGKLREGFDAFNPDQTFTRKMEGPEITESVIKQIRNRDSRRFFLFAQYFEAHDPYQEHEEFGFGSDKIARYDSEVAAVDRELGRVMEELKRLGLWDSTIIAVFADHGEGLGDHGFQTHNTSLYEAEVRVPMVLRVPGLPGRRVDAAVSLIDLMPTVAKILGVEDPVQRMGGGIVPWMLGYENLPERTLFSQVFVDQQTIGIAETRCVIYDRHKLIERVLSPQSDYELYDLRQDPEESRNLFRPEGGPAIQARLLGFLHQKVELVRSIAGDSRDADPLAALREDLEAGLARLAAEDEKERRAGAVNLREALLNRYDELTELARRLDPEFLAEVNARVLAAAEAQLPGWNHELLRVIGLLGRPESADYCRKLLRDEREHIRYAAALTLVRLGPEAARDALPLLREFVARESDPVARFDAVMALSRAGVHEGLALYAPILRGDSTWEVAPILTALAAAADPAGLELMGDRLGNNEYLDYTTRVLLLDYAAACPGEAADRVCLALGADSDSGIRERSVDLLAARHGPERAETMRAHYELEREARTALSDGQAEISSGVLENYVKTVNPIPARVFLSLARSWLGVPGDHREDVARALRGARDLGEEPESAAATRMLEHLDELKWFYERPELKAEVKAVYVPTTLRRNRCYGVQIELTNTSDRYWTGGRWNFGLVLRAKIVDADGKVLPGVRNIDNPLPVAGIAPGETVRVIVMGHAPSGRWTQGRIAIALTQRNNGKLSDESDFIAVLDRTFDPR
ncbi:MAG: sulfatase-like hydrolase/transferase [Planctomycetota bacterium]